MKPYSVRGASAAPRGSGLRIVASEKNMLTSKVNRAMCTGTCHQRSPDFQTAGNRDRTLRGPGREAWGVIPSGPAGRQNPSGGVLQTAAAAPLMTTRPFIQTALQSVRDHLRAAPAGSHPSLVPPTLGETVMKERRTGAVNSTHASLSLRRRRKAASLTAGAL